MAIAGDDLRFSVLATDTATPVLAAVENSLRRVESTAARTASGVVRSSQQMSSAFIRLQQVTQGLVAGVSIASGGYGALIGLWLAARNPIVGLLAGLVALTIGTLRAAAAWEIGITTLTNLEGSGTKAYQQMLALADFAAKTPFELANLLRANNQLRAFGFTGEEALYIMERLGNTVAAFGDFSAQKIDQITLAIGRLKGGGKSVGETFETLRRFGISQKQLIEHGIEFSKGGKLLSSTEKVIDAVLKVMDDKFSGMMVALNDTVAGQVSNMKDLFFQLFAELGGSSIGPFKAFLEFINTGLERMIEILRALRKSAVANNLAKAFKNLGQALEPIAALVGLVARAIATAGFFTLLGLLEGVALAMNAVAAILTFVIRRMRAVVAVVKQMLSPLKSLWDAFRKIWSVIKSLDWAVVLQSLKDMLLNVLTTVITWFTDKAPELAASLPDPLATIANAVIKVALVTLEIAKTKLPDLFPKDKLINPTEPWESGAPGAPDAPDSGGFLEFAKNVAGTVLGLAAFKRLLDIVKPVVPIITKRLGALWGIFFKIGRIFSRGNLILLGVSLLIELFMTLETRTQALSRAFEAFTSGNILEGFKILGEGFAELWTNVIMPKLNAMITAFSTLWDKISPSLNTAMQGIILWATDLWTNVSREVTAFFNNIVNFFRGKPEELKASTSDWGPAAVDWIIKAAEGVGTWITNFVESIGTWISQLTPEVIASFSKWLDAALQWVKDAAVKVPDELTTFTNTVVNWIIDKSIDVIGAFTLWLNAATDWVINSLPDLMVNLATFLADLLEWMIGTALPDIIIKLIDWQQAIVDWVDNSLPDLLISLGLLLLAVLKFASDSVAELQATWNKWWYALIDSITARVPEILVALGKLKDAIVRWVTEALPTIHTSFTSLGQKIVSGIMNGMKDLVSKVANRVKKALSKIPGGAHISAALTANADALPRAKGGIDIVRKPTLFLAGESGPEIAAFAPTAGGARLMNPMAGSGGITIGKIEINVTEARNAKATAQEVSTKMARNLGSQRTLLFESFR